MVEYGNLKYAPNDDKPYSGRVFDLYQDGSKRIDGMFHKGQRSGRWIFYFRDGKKNYEVVYRANSEHQKIIYFNKDGSVNREGALINGKRRGGWTYVNSYMASKDAEYLREAIISIYSSSILFYTQMGDVPYSIEELDSNGFIDLSPLIKQNWEFELDLAFFEYGFETGHIYARSKYDIQDRSNVEIIFYIETEEFEINEN